MFNNTFFNVNTDCFLQHHYHIYIEQEGRQTVRAYEADWESKRNHIISTLGEFFEREVLTNNNPIAKEKCRVVSLITGQEKVIAINKVLFVDQFVDSCGMASHYFAEEVVWKAYKEYFERQALITSFLFELSGNEIIISSNKKLDLNDQYLLNYLDEIHYYSISLCRDLHVVLAIGYGKKTKAAGIGTSRNIEKAVEKAQKEILQYFSVAFSKNSSQQYDTSLYFGKKDIYHEKFDAMSTEDFEKQYKYLRNSQKVEIQYFDTNYSVRRSEIVHNNYKLLGMEPYIAMFNGPERLGIKVVKILDFNWFPHMRPELYSEELCFNMEKKIGKKMRKEAKWIPFA